MVEKFKPEINKAYLIDQYTMIHILNGSGMIQVDFKNFDNWSDKLIFLEKGQYIKFINDDFLVRKIEFNDVEIFRNQNFRVLFKHLVSLGYINFSECTDCQNYLNNSIFSNPNEILDVSAKQWFWQNPFQANSHEYHIIFDVKDIVDHKFKNHLNNSEIAKLIRQYDMDAQSIYKDKVGLSIKKMFANKRLLESQKEIAFTGKSIKEISYEFGYNDPAYFNRIFKSNVGKTPNEFRENIAADGIDSFIMNINELLSLHHDQQRNVDFYADKMHMSVQTLSKKVQEKMQITIGQLIRQQIILTAKKHLDEHVSVKEVSHLLNFEESNHFSSFFKHYTGLTPSQYQSKKVQ
ncbi:MAG: helix-turn-helix domain-containing protein [Bacteroidia bacterium]|nr:helix-turn-helix domain-containing protein [Bacteroidia bacterium]